MRVTVDLGGRRTVVEVAEDASSVRVGERTYPVRVLARTATRVDLDIGGEAVVVDSWPEGSVSPPGPVIVNGERFTAEVVAERSGSVSGGSPATTAPPVPSGTAAVPTSPAGPSAGIAVVPPMPGRVVEVRVRSGQVVAKGSVLLVLEAMKMRNEVTSPADGVVSDLRVEEGTNVRAREPMLRVVPPP